MYLNCHVIISMYYTHYTLSLGWGQAPPDWVLCTRYASLCIVWRRTTLSTDFLMAHAFRNNHMTRTLLLTLPEPKSHPHPPQLLPVLPPSSPPDPNVALSPHPPQLLPVLPPPLPPDPNVALSTVAFMSVMTGVQEYITRWKEVLCQTIKIVI